MPIRPPVSRPSTRAPLLILAPLALALLSQAPLAAPARADDLADAKALVVSRTRYDEARRLLEKVTAADPRQAEAFRLLAQVDLGLEAFPEAQKAAEAAVALEPTRAAGHLLRARAIVPQIDDASIFHKSALATEVRTSLEAAVAAEPRNVEAHRFLMQFYAQAPGIVGGSMDKAKAEGAVIAQLDPVEGQVMAAALHPGEEGLAEAETLLRAAVAAAPDRARPLALLAVNLVNQRRYDDAQAVLDQCLRLEPENSMARFTLARLNLSAPRDLDKARDLFQAYLARIPEPEAPPHAAAHWRLGQVLEAQGDRDGALREYQEALRLRPGLTQAKESLAALRKKPR